jgi:hypothetical protein
LPSGFRAVIASSEFFVLTCADFSNDAPPHRADPARAAAALGAGLLLVAFQTMVSVGDMYFIGRLGTGPLAGLAHVFRLIMLLQ